MKRTLTFTAASAILFAGLGVAAANTKSASSVSSAKPAEATGCLQPSSVAKTYVVKSSDGTTWGVTEDRDLMLNNYVGRTVTVAGNPIHPKASERSAIGAAHYMHAMDVAVDNDTCQQ